MTSDPSEDHEDRPGPIRPRRVMLLGATGTVGRATLQALLRDGHLVTCFVRREARGNQHLQPFLHAAQAQGATIRFGDVTQKDSLQNDGFQGERFDVLASCMASRTGTADDAWAIDYKAHSDALHCAISSGIQHMVLLSAICVQKPRLAFQHAKLAFERELVGSGVTYSIVRPTALFKSLSGQIDRLRRGKAFLVFGDGTLTSCKPISNEDLASYLARCIWDKSLQNGILPIGGPGPAITPKQQGEALFKLLGKTPRFAHVPVGLLDVIIKTLSMLGTVNAAMAKKAELARIGRYYATESMLVLDTDTGSYSAQATPSTGADQLFTFYAELIAGTKTVERGEHAVF